MYACRPSVFIHMNCCSVAVAHEMVTITIYVLLVLMTLVGALINDTFFTGIFIASILSFWRQTGCVTYSKLPS